MDSVDKVLDLIKCHAKDGAEWIKDNPRLSLALAASGLLGYWVYREGFTRPKGIPPGPRGLPIIGNRHQLDFTQIHKDFQRLGEKYGDVFTVYIGHTPYVILNSYSAIKEGFVQKAGLFAGRPPAIDYHDAINEEVFMGDYSEEWKFFKKFGSSAIKKFGGPISGIEDTIHKECRYLIETLTNYKGQPVNPIEYFYQTTTNVMSVMIYDKYYEDHADPEFLELLENVKGWYMVLNRCAPQSEMYPEWVMAQLYKDLGQIFVDTSTFLREHTLRAIEQVKDRMDPDSPKSFLEHFLANRDVEKMGGWNNFADTIAIYTVDPVDSLSIMTLWAMLYCSTFPEVQKELQDLIDKECGESELAGLGHRARLGLLDSFLLEMLRHCSFICTSFCHTVSAPAPVTFRGHAIPQEAGVLANFYAVHRDPAIFPEPEKFKPRRFVSDTGKFIKSDAVMTFSIGTRVCPGEQYAKQQMFLTVANLLKAFSVSLRGDRPPPPLEPQQRDFFKSPHDFEVVFTRRN